MTTTTAKRLANGAALLGLVLLLLFLAWAWLLPPADASTPGTPPEDLSSCVAALDTLDARAFALVLDLDDTRATLALVEGDRERLVDEVDRLNRRVDRQAATIARLRDRLGR